jgi:hypothetical protein
MFGPPFCLDSQIFFTERISKFSLPLLHSDMHSGICFLGMSYVARTLTTLRQKGSSLHLCPAKQRLIIQEMSCFMICMTYRPVSELFYDMYDIQTSQ